MEFDFRSHKCTIVIDEEVGIGHAVNAASIIGVSFGRLVKNLVGPNMYSKDNINYPGVIYSPLPILLANQEYIQSIHESTVIDDDIHTMPFSALAQSCKTYQEYESRMSTSKSSDIELVAVGLIGPKKKINKLTGSLMLFR